jgi:hypothetical protein
MIKIDVKKSKQQKFRDRWSRGEISREAHKNKKQFSDDTRGNMSFFSGTHMGFPQIHVRLWDFYPAWSISHVPLNWLRYFFRHACILFYFSGKGGFYYSSERVQSVST